MEYKNNYIFLKKTFFKKDSVLACHIGYNERGYCLNVYLEGVSVPMFIETGALTTAEDLYKNISECISENFTNDSEIKWSIFSDDAIGKKIVERLKELNITTIGKLKLLRKEDFLCRNKTGRKAWLQVKEIIDKL